MGQTERLLTDADSRKLRPSGSKREPREEHIVSTDVYLIVMDRHQSAGVDTPWFERVEAERSGGCHIANIETEKLRG